MILHHSAIEIQGKRVFERLQFKNIGSSPKVLENEACFMFLLSGNMNVFGPTQVTALKRNDCLLSQCGQYVFEEVQKPQEEAPIVDMVGIFFHLDLLKELFETGPLPSVSKAYLAYRMDEDVALNHYKQNIIHYMDHPAAFSKEMQWLKLKEILLILAQTEQAPSVAHLLSSLFTPAEYDFREVIRGHLYSHLSLEQLAGLCNMSLATFKRHFQSHYNTSPALYFREQRLANAEALLRTSGNPISEIAAASGFESIATFNRQFKERYGKSPSAYRMR